MILAQLERDGASRVGNRSQEIQPISDCFFLCPQGVRSILNANQNGLDTAQRIKRCISKPATNELLVCVTAIATFRRLQLHMNGVGHESAWFHSREMCRMLLTSGTGKSVHALIGHNSIHVRQTTQFHNSIFFPRHGSGWVLV